MHSEGTTPSPDPALLGTAVSVAPAAIGCAVGLLIADKMKSRARGSLAGSLFAVGVLATLPFAIDYIAKTANSPSKARGRTRRLDAIGQGGIDPETDIIGGEEYFVEETV